MAFLKSLHLFSAAGAKRNSGGRGWTAPAVGLALWGLILFLPAPAYAQGEQRPAGEGREPARGRPEASSSAGASASQISESQLVGLPLNGRSYTQLATLQAGVSDPSAASGSRGVSGGNITVSGGRASSNNFLLDGTSIMDTNNRVPRSAAGVQLGSDAVLQVQVFSLNSGAEYGRGSGGVLNSITRSGANEFHASLFEFFRNSKLDARNFFDPDKEPPPFKRNQFGFTVSGPLRKERTFFLASFEAMRDRLNSTDYSLFPDAPARDGLILAPDGVVIAQVPVGDKVKPYLALYPLPNGPRIGNGIAENRAPQFLPTDENFFSVRVDHQLTDRDSLFARYSFDDASSLSTQGGTYLFSSRAESRQQYLTLVGSHIFSPSALVSFRLGYTRPVDSGEPLTVLDIPRSLYFSPDAPFIGQITFPGGATFGAGTNLPEGNTMNAFQFSGDLVLQKEAHSWKFGFEAHRYRWDLFSSSQRNGSWAFNSLENFLQGSPNGTSLTVALPGSDNRQAYRQTLMGFYAQDSYAVRPQLRLLLGLRYELATLIHDRDGKTASLADPFRDTQPRVGPLVDHNPSLHNLAPRIAITGNPWRRTVLSASFGIYYDQLLAYLVKEQRNTVPFYRIAVRTECAASAKLPQPCAFPDAAASAAGVPLQAQTLDYQGLTSPMVLRYHFAVQQQIGAGWGAQAAYVGSRGNHLFRSYETNLFPLPITQADGSLFFPPNAGPVNPAFSSITFLASDAQSFYNSLQVSANKSLSHGLSLQASYTFSKSVDDASTHGSGSSQFGLLRTLDRGLSDFDIRHRVSVNYFYHLPWGAGRAWWKSGVLGQVFGSWRLGGIVSYRTGTPFSPQLNVRRPEYLFAPSRPNLVPGRSNNPVLGGRDQYFDATAFSVPEPGTLGNLGRNTITAPNAFVMDVSLQKDVSLGNQRRLQFRADIFNLPNHTNFNRNIAGSVVVFTGSTGRLNPGAGRIGTTVTTSRQMQFALRLSF